jgi:hypothetical protein
MIERDAQDATITIRVSNSRKTEIESTLKNRGVTNLSAWVRQLIEKELFTVIKIDKIQEEK